MFETYVGNYWNCVKTIQLKTTDKVRAANMSTSMQNFLKIKSNWRNNKILMFVR